MLDILVMTPSAVRSDNNVWVLLTALSVVFNAEEALRCWLNGQIVWERKGPYLEVSPDVVWLASAAGSSGSFKITSNTDWVII